MMLVENLGRKYVKAGCIFYVVIKNDRFKETAKSVAWICEYQFAHLTERQLADYYLAGS